MKSNTLKILSFLILSLISISCSTKVAKMPITTSSEEARELYEKGVSLSERIRTLEAVNYFEQAIAKDSNFALAYLQLAFTSSTPKQFRDYFSKAYSLIDSISEGEKLWILSVEAGNIDSDPEQMMAYLKRLVEMYPDDERVQYLLASAYFGRQEYDLAIPLYKKAIEINPDFSPVYNQLGYVYRYLKNYSEAEKMFKKYIELIPNDPNPYDSYAELLLEMGEYDRSIENYKKALSINPYFYFSHVGIATNLNIKEDHVGARAQLQELYRTAKRDDQKRLALFAIATSYIDEGNYDLAIKEMDKRMEISRQMDDPSTIANDFNLIGLIYFMEGKYPKAMEMFTQSRGTIEANDIPDNIKRNNYYQTAFNITMVKLKLGKIDEARESMQEYLDFAEQVNSPNLDRAAHLLKGIFAFGTGEYEQADQELRQADQRNPYTLYLLGETYEALNDLDKAKAFYQKAATINLVNSINFAFVREKAEAKIEALSQNT